MFLENNFIYKNTFVNKLNPLIKFIIFLAVIFLVFLKINLLTQILLLLFVGFVAWKGDCKHVLKKSISVYIFLLLFLFTVNFFFLKTPGFWTDINFSKYTDMLGILKPNTPSVATVKSGWFFGGEILRNKSGNDIFSADSISCLESIIRKTGNSSSSCTAAEHTHPDNVTSGKWKIVPVRTGDFSNGSENIKYVAFLPVWYTISHLQIVNALALTNKIIMIMILSAVFSITSSLSSFTYALEDLFRPTRVFKFPDKIMALAAAISIRFAPSLISEASRIIKAQASRGIDYKNGRFRDKLSALLSLFVPLFVISFFKSGELAEAMKARGYDHTQARSSYKIYRADLMDLLVFGGSIFFLSSLYYMFFNGYFLSIFSMVECLVLLAQ